MGSLPLLREHWRVLVLLGLTAGVTAPALSAGFVSDDDGVIVRGHVIHDASLWTEMLKHPAMFVNANGGVLAEDHTYRPVPVSLFFLEAPFAGREPFLYHLSNWLLHLINVGLVYALARRLLSPTRRQYAWLAAALFASAPHLAEAYVWINGRSDPLAALFALAALLVWRPALAENLTRGRRLARFAATSVLFFLALLSKEIWLIAWPAMLVIPWLARFDAKRRLLAVTPFAAAALATLAVRSLVLQSAQRGATTTRTLAALPRVPLLLLDGLSELVAPTRLYWRQLCIEYNALAPWTFAAAAAVCLVLAGLAVASFRKAPLVLWSCTWFGLTLAPAAMITLSPGWGGFGRYLYVPAVAFALLFAEGIGWLAEQLQSRGRPPALAPCLAALLVLRQGALLAHETGDYASDASLYLDVTKRAPEAAHGYLGLAYIMFERGQPAHALELFRKASQRDPSSFEAELGIIQALELVADHTGAEREARRVLARVPPQRANLIRTHLVANIHLHAPEEAAQLLTDCLSNPFEQALCDPWIARLTHDHPLSERYRALFAARAPGLPPNARRRLDELSRPQGTPGSAASAPASPPVIP